MQIVLNYGGTHADCAELRCFDKRVLDQVINELN